MIHQYILANSLFPELNQNCEGCNSHQLQNIRRPINDWLGHLAYPFEFSIMPLELL